jgi:hypothetical protein
VCWPLAATQTNRRTVKRHIARYGLHRDARERELEALALVDKRLRRRDVGPPPAAPRRREPEQPEPDSDSEMGAASDSDANGDLFNGVFDGLGDPGDEVGRREWVFQL